MRIYFDITIALLMLVPIVLSWITIWMIIKNHKIAFAIPFLLVGFSSLFYVGLIIYSSVSEIYDVILEALYFVSTLILFALALGRFLWRR